MGKTKNCFIVSESTGYTLCLNNDTNSLELIDRSHHLWTKHNWLFQRVVRDESNYDAGFIDGQKGQSGQLRYEGKCQRFISMSCFYLIFAVIVLVALYFAYAHYRQAPHGQ